jgi:nucleotidyltransferase/DNA polymerase involved in DNA repair
VPLIVVVTPILNWFRSAATHAVEKRIESQDRAHVLPIDECFVFTRTVAINTGDALAEFSLAI